MITALNAKNVSMETNGGRRMLRMIRVKRPPCKHEWKRMWLEFFQFSRKEKGYSTEEIWCYECEKCGERKFIVNAYENNGVFDTGGDENGQG